MRKKATISMASETQFSPVSAEKDVCATNSGGEDAGNPNLAKEKNDQLNIFLVETGNEIQHQLSTLLRRAGFTLTCFSQHSELNIRLRTTRPVAVFLEMLCDNEQNVLMNLDCHSKLSALKIPTMLLADADDMASRLRASRAGITHYLTQPIDIDILLDKLSSHVNSKEEEPYRVLIVDDDELLTSLYELTLQQAGFKVMTQVNAIDIINVIRQFQPELIFMDVQMPGCSGPEAAAVIRQVPGFDVIPIVFLSGDTKLELQLAALTRGGDDFLTKPINSTHLVVTATARAARARGLQQSQQRLRQSAAELKRYQQTAEHEQTMAQELMSRMIYSEDLADESMHFWHQPANRFSGDLVAAVRDKSQRLYLLHADAMGHGLPAALPLLPVSQIFNAMAKQGFTIGAIAATMNEKLRIQIPVGNFVACTLLSIDKFTRTVEVWNGGSPDSFFINKNGVILKRFKSKHTALGVRAADDFSHETEIYQWPEAGDIALYSDGLMEACNQQGVDFTEQLEAAFTSPLTTQSVNRLQIVVDKLKAHLDGEQAHDDISIVVIRCENTA